MPNLSPIADSPAFARRTAGLAERLRRGFGRGRVGLVAACSMLATGVAVAEGSPATAWPDVGPDFPPPAAVAPLAEGEPLRATLAKRRPDSADDLRVLQRRVRLVTARARPATVSIELNDSLGSGVIVTADGLVLTAGHVTVEPNREVRVRLPDNRRLEGVTLGVNHRVDSGLVKITTPPPAGGWPHTPLASADAETGEWVLALGHPNGFDAGRAPPLRVGRVLMTEDGTLSTDATLVGGDSGGPLLNLRGEVVGIHSRIGERITSNFHVPVGAYRRGWPRLTSGRMTGVPDGEKATQFRPHAGVALQADAEGCVITQVFPGSPAEQAGLRAGDRLRRLGGQAVGDPRQLGRLLRRCEPFERVEVAYERADVPLETTVWLGRVDRGFPGLGTDTATPAATSGGAG